MIVPAVIIFCFALSTAIEEGHYSYLVLPAIGLGTAGMGSATADTVRTALRLGVRLIDTAQAREWYDEAAVGRAAKQFILENPHALEPMIVTKIHPRSYALNEMRRELNISYHNLEPISLTGVLLHAPFCWQGHCENDQMVDWREAWKNLETLKDEFNIQYIGVSNFDYEQIEELVMRIADRKVSFLQNWMDPLHQDVAVKDFCADHSIQYMAYSSFGTQWQMSRRVGNANPVLSNPVLLDIARRHDKTVTEIILEWLSAEGVVSLPRSTKLDHLSENFRVCSGSTWCTDSSLATFLTPTFLTDEDTQQIRNLDGTLGSPWD